MKPTNCWLFGLWILVATAGLLSLFGMLTIGIFVAPIALLLFVIATILTVRRPGRVHATIGAAVPIPWAVVVLSSYGSSLGELITFSIGSVLASVATGVAFGVCEGRRAADPRNRTVALPARLP